MPCAHKSSDADVCPMYDVIESLKRSTIQHGPYNNRIYLMALHTGDLPDIIPAMDRLAAARGYTKIVARIPASAWPAFAAAGYVREAGIPGYFSSGEDLFFAALFPAPERAEEAHPEAVNRHLALIRGKRPGRPRSATTGPVSVEPCDPGEVEAMCRVYRHVYPSYPFPITDPAFLAHAMVTHTTYYCIRRSDRIVALAGSEIDSDNRCVEMTDFAVLPPYRRQGLALLLLERMQRDMAARDMRVAFTISRTLSPGMNVTFRKMGYRLGGKLTNNSQISGGVESMWIWHKKLK